MPSKRNFFDRIALTIGVIAASAVIGATSHGAFAQANNGAPNFRVQSAPAADPISAPKRSAKPIPGETQAAAGKAKAFKPAPEPAPAPEQNAVRTGSNVPPPGERRFNANEVVI